MIEQHVADRFRDAVADEPPLGFDPDQVIDRAVKHTRRRRVVLAVAGATMVEAVAVWALAAAPGSARDDQVQAGGNDNPPATAPASGAPAPNGEVRLTSFEEVLTLGNPLAHVPDGESLSVTDLVVRNPDGDKGTVQLKRAEQVIFEASMENFQNYDMHFTQPITADPGVPVTLAVNCTTSTRGCQGASMSITGYTVVLNR